MVVFSGSDICSAWNPVCLGTLLGVIGKMKTHSGEDIECYMFDHVPRLLSAYLMLYETDVDYSQDNNILLCQVVLFVLQRLYFTSMINVGRSCL